MIKSLNKDDINSVPFVVSKRWRATSKSNINLLGDVDFEYLFTDANFVSESKTHKFISESKSFTNKFVAENTVQSVGLLSTKPFAIEYLDYGDGWQFGCTSSLVAEPTYSIIMEDTSSGQVDLHVQGSSDYWLLESYADISNSKSPYNGPSYRFDLAMDVPFTNSICNLCLEQTEDNFLTIEDGIKTEQFIKFDPDIEVQNLSDTYKRIIYDQTKNLFYNDSKDPTKLLGLENLDVILDGKKRVIYDRIKVVTIPQAYFGDKIMENSVEIIENSSDQTYTVVDDGKGNLHVKEKVFGVITSDQNKDINHFNSCSCVNFDGVEFFLNEDSVTELNWQYYKNNILFVDRNFAHDFYIYGYDTTNKIKPKEVESYLMYIGDAGFDVGGGIQHSENSDSASVMAMAIQTDDKVLIGGRFTSYNNTPSSILARINIDGTLDGPFNNNLNLSFRGNVYNYVTSILIYPTSSNNSGKILIGGNFIYSGKQGIVRINSNGTLDETFNGVGVGFNNVVTDIALQSDEKIIAVGSFTSYNGYTVPSIVRLNKNGEIDTTFTSSGYWTNQPNPPTPALNILNKVIVYPTGNNTDKILIGGEFIALTSSGGPVNRDRYLIRLKKDGEFDNDFGYYNHAGGINDMVLLPDEKIIIAGSFGSNPHGIQRLKPPTTNITVSRDETFNIEPPQTGTEAYPSRSFSVALQSDGKILLGGIFNRYDNTPEQHSILRLNSDGELDTTFRSGLPLAEGLLKAVDSIKPLSDGRIMIGGKFSTYDGQSVNNIARLNNNGRLQTTQSVSLTKIPHDELLGNFRKIECGDNFAAILKTNGQLVVWGESEVSKSVPIFGGLLIDISAGDHHMIALDENGKVYVWGNSLYTGSIPTFVDNNYSYIKAGPSGSVIIHKNGSIYGFGHNSLTSSFFTASKIPQKSNVKKISFGKSHGMILDNDGNLYSWGANDTYSQSKIPNLENVNISDVQCGDDHTIILKNNGECVAWGKNDYSQSFIPFGQNINSSWSNPPPPTSVATKGLIDGVSIDAKADRSAVYIKKYTDVSLLQSEFGHAFKFGFSWGEHPFVTKYMFKSIGLGRNFTFLDPNIRYQKFIYNNDYTSPKVMKGTFDFFTDVNFTINLNTTKQYNLTNYDVKILPTHEPHGTRLFSGLEILTKKYNNKEKYSYIASNKAQSNFENEIPNINNISMSVGVKEFYLNTGSLNLADLHYGGYRNVPVYITQLTSDISMGQTGSRNYNVTMTGKFLNYNKSQNKLTVYIDSATDNLVHNNWAIDFEKINVYEIIDELDLSNSKFDKFYFNEIFLYTTSSNMNSIINDEQFFIKYIKNNTSDNVYA